MNIDKRIKDELGQYLLNPLISYEYSSEAVKVFVKQLFQELIDEVIGEDYHSIKMPFHKEKSYTIYLTTNPKLERKSTQIKNKLRAKQRQRAKELLEKL